jgi:cytochrome c oxidase cbb3-type subunit III
MSHGFLRLSMLVLLLSTLQEFSSAQMQGRQIGTPPPPGSSDALEGQRIFATSCAACHGLDARGGERGPDIANKKDVQQLPEEALLRILQDGVAGTGMPAFRSLGAAQLQAVVRHLRSLQGQGAAVAFPGDPGRGKELFFAKGGCSQCHMANGEGGFVGSDLSSYTTARSPDDIRSAITDPDRNLDPRKRPVTVTTMGGKTQTGLARNEDNFSLQFQALDGTFHLFAKSELRSIEYETRSLMPADYGSRLSHQEVDDLVSFVMSIARTNAKRPAGKD